MQWAKRDRVARWFWQTLAWSGGRWAGHNHLEQYRTGVSLAGGTVDLCRSKTADYGQWGVDDVTPEDAQMIAKAVADHQVNDFITGRSIPPSLMWQATRADANQGESVARSIAAKLDAQTAALAAIAEQLGQLASGGGSLDTEAVIAAVNAAAERAGAEARDAVADSDEGGAAQVRTDAD
jgi:hypothetical protein